jgi:hypothetical protein
MRSSKVWSGHKEPRAFSVIGLLFPISLVVGWFAGLTSTSIAQFKAREFFDSVSDKCVIAINGRSVQDRDEILNVLKALGDLPAHHSSPTHRIAVELSDPPRQLSLWLARDSNNPHEYWVFSPSPSRFALRAELKKDIGHIVTTAFDESNDLTGVAADRWPVPAQIHENIFISIHARSRQRGLSSVSLERSE